MLAHDLAGRSLEQVVQVAHQIAQRISRETTLCLRPLHRRRTRRHSRHGNCVLATEKRERWLVEVKETDYFPHEYLVIPTLVLESRFAFEAGGTACTVLNAANEVAVSSFLKGNVSFTAIPDIIESINH